MQTQLTNYYRMFPEHHFAFVRIQSEIFSVQEAIQLNQEYKADKVYTDIHYLLIMIDERCTPGFSTKELEKLSHIYTNEFQINNHKKVVWLVSEPIFTAMTHLFVSYTNDLYCSTIARAYELLDMPLEFPAFLNLISL
jgi:hypothetical protein